MRRWVFYLAISGLAFGIGVIGVFFYFYQSSNSVCRLKVLTKEEVSRYETLNDRERHDPPRKKEPLTDRERFLLLYQPTIDKWLKDEPLKETVESSPEIVQKIGEMRLAYYEEQSLLKTARKPYKPKLIDVNGDGRSELQIIAEGDTANLFDCLILKKTRDDFEIVFYAYESFSEFKLSKSRHKGHFDIELSEYYPDAPSLGKDLYRFDGQKYEHHGCYDYTYRYKDKNGRWQPLKKPVLERLDDCC